MSKREIVRILSYDEEPGETGYLGYHDPSHVWETTASSSTLEEYADLCDREAVARNNHKYNGVHRILAALLYQRVGRAVATGIMREIAEYGGMDGMNGVGRAEGAFADLGVPEYGDWRLPS